MAQYRAKNITTQTTTTLSTGPATLGVVTVNTAAASAVAKIYDGPAATGVLLATIDASAARQLVFACWVKTGLVVVTSGGNADITVTYE